MHKNSVKDFGKKGCMLERLLLLQSEGIGFLSLAMTQHAFAEYQYIYISESQTNRDQVIPPGAKNKPKIKS